MSIGTCGFFTGIEGFGTFPSISFHSPTISGRSRLFYGIWSERGIDRAARTKDTLDGARLLEVHQSDLCLGHQVGKRREISDERLLGDCQ